MKQGKFRFILAIAVLVGVTCLFGGASTQAHSSHDHNSLDQHVTPTPSASPRISHSPSTSGAVQGLQKTPQPTSHSVTSSPTPSATPLTTSGETVPLQETGAPIHQTPQPTATPEAGSGLDYMVPLAVMIGLFAWYQRERKLVLEALRTK